MGNNTIMALIHSDTYLSTLPESIIMSIMDNTYDYAQDLVMLNMQGYPLMPALIKEVQEHLNKFLQAVTTTKKSYMTAS